MAGPYEDSQEDRTESATTFRREEFRKQGIVAQSREVLSVVLFISTGLALYLLATNIFSEFREFARATFQFSRLEALTTKTTHELLIRILTSLGIMVGPLFAVVMVAGILGGIAQVGLYFTTEPILPNWDRINPVKGFQRVFSTSGATEAAKALLKIIVIGTVAWAFLKNRAFVVGSYFQKGVPELTAVLLGDLLRMFFIVVASLIGFAALDYLYQRYRVEKQMRMTRREIKEEYKLREGDPLIKSRIRSIQRRIARRRMMEAVPKADVVVTNPTHYAVAIQYFPGKMRAPKVVAKGVDFLALKIRELAKNSGVPIVENKPLARSLYRQVDVGKVITEDLYGAVAQVLTHVYRLKGVTSMQTNAA